MKLKEKLAEEYAKKLNRPGDEGRIVIAEVSFLAGLAQEKLNRFTFQAGFESGLVLGEKTKTIMCEFGLGTILNDLGQEEVE